MKCPYCNKAVRDMPNHLEKNKQCYEKHKIKLKEGFINSLIKGGRIVGQVGGEE